MSEQTAEKKEKKESYDIDDLFTDSRAQQSGNNLVLSLIGPTECGKTYMSLDFPGPIRVVNLDYGLTENLKYYPNKEITDMKPTAFADTQIDGNSEYKWDKVNPIHSLKKFEAGIGALIRDQHGGTVVIDTMTTVNDWLKMLLDYKTDKDGTQTDGKISMFDWKWVNQKWKWLWQLIKTIDANVVVLFRDKDVYENFKKTGEQEPDYRDGTKFEVSVEIMMTIDVTQTSGGKVEVKRYSTFSKFRGVKLSQTYRVENLDYAGLMKILKEENKI